MMMVINAVKLDFIGMAGNRIVIIERWVNPATLPVDIKFKIFPLTLEALNYVHEIHAVLSSAATSAKTLQT
jgi:hypothetical protein